MHSNNIDFLLRLPGAIDIPSFSSRKDRILDLPLVVRMAKRSREHVRTSFGIPRSAKVVLITFGGFSVTPASSLCTPSSSRQSSSISLLSNLALTVSNTVIGHSEDFQKNQPSELLPTGWYAIIAVPGQKGDLIDALLASNTGHITVAPSDAVIPFIFFGWFNSLNTIFSLFQI